MSGQKEVAGEERGCACKVGRNAGAYGLDRLDERLLDRRGDGASLRDLEAVVNRAVLLAALRDAREDVIGDVGSVYEKLTGDDASAGERAETRNRLARAGVDVETLREDFVSYQTVRTHLRECLEVDTAREQSLTRTDALGTIQWARSRSDGIIERTIERLQGRDEFHAGDIEVSQVVRVSCPDCGTSDTVEAFVEGGGCQCGPESGNPAEGADG